jgi:hypothetical protein
VVKKSAHPEQLFEYLVGGLGEETRQAVDEHLSACAECRAVADLARSIKASVIEFEAHETHPDISELASFFYNKPSKQKTRSLIASHVAKCRSCADELAEYAIAERAAAAYHPSQAVPAEVPAAAWESIREWEESNFAKPKVASYGLSRDMISKLTGLVAEREEQLKSEKRDLLTHPEAGAERPGLVPVIVVDRTGKLRGVEMFEKATDERGANVLKYVGNAERYDNRPFHALLDFGDRKQVVVSDLILRDEIRLPRVERADADLRGADYFIIED